MTFEERKLPPQGLGPDAGQHQIPTLQRFHFGVEETELKLIVPEHEADMVEPAEPEAVLQEDHRPVNLDRDLQPEEDPVDVYGQLDLSSSEDEDVIITKTLVILDKSGGGQEGRVDRTN